MAPRKRLLREVGVGWGWGGDQLGAESGDGDAGHGVIEQVDEEGEGQSRVRGAVCDGEVEGAVGQALHQLPPDLPQHSAENDQPAPDRRSELFRAQAFPVSLLCIHNYFAFILSSLSPTRICKVLGADGGRNLLEASDEPIVHEQIAAELKGVAAVLRNVHTRSSSAHVCKNDWRSNLSGKTVQIAIVPGRAHVGKDARSEVVAILQRFFDDASVCRTFPNTSTHCFDLIIPTKPKTVGVEISKIVYLNSFPDTKPTQIHNPLIRSCAARKSHVHEKSLKNT